MRNNHQSSKGLASELPMRADKASFPQRSSIEKPEKYQEKELYQLCQQLTRENRHLKREVADLKRLVAGREEESLGFRSESEENYRELNYQCYKKKAVHLLTSLKFIQNLYVEKCSLDKRQKILDRFMGKIRQGGINHIDQLLALYGQCLNGREQDNWNVDELERESSQYQNNILRKHIKKLNSIMLENVSWLKNNLNSLKVDIVANSDKISQQLHYYCQKYMAKDVAQSITQPPAQSKNSKKPRKKKANDENGIQKATWQQILDQRSKLKELKLEPNVKQKIHQSLVIVDLQQSINKKHSLSSKPSIPKPPSKCKKQEITIIDELKHSKNVGSSLTPSHAYQSKGVSSNFNYSRKSSKKHYVEAFSQKKSQSATPRKTSSYYR